MKFGNYISTGNKRVKKKRYGFLVFFGVGAETDSLTSSSKDRSTDSFFSYLLARFLGFFSFMRIKLRKKKYFIDQNQGGVFSYQAPLLYPLY